MAIFFYSFFRNTPMAMLFLKLPLFLTKIIFKHERQCMDNGK